MSDLTALFANPPQTIARPPQHSRSCSKGPSQTGKSALSLAWTIKDIESHLKNNIKEKMDEQSLAHELQTFEAQQKKEFI